MSIVDDLNKLIFNIAALLSASQSSYDAMDYDYTPFLQIELKSEDGGSIFIRNGGQGRALNVKIWIEDEHNSAWHDKNTAIYRETLEIGGTFSYPLKDWLGKYNPNIIRTQYDSVQGIHFQSRLSHASHPRPELSYREIDDDEIVNPEDSNWNVQHDRRGIDF